MSPTHAAATRPFTAEERARLLDAYWSTVRAQEEASLLADRAEGAAAQRLVHHERAYSDRLSALWEAYLAGLPDVALSRCPFTREVLRIPIDTQGLDGLFWKYEGAARPEPPSLPSFLALAGSVSLGDARPFTPFLCRPGPEVPYVVPRVLENRDVSAVISRIAIGGLAGHAIAYYAQRVPHDLARVNTWGTNQYVFRDADGRMRWDVQPDLPSEWDFDLSTWIARGKLQWIAPEDPSLTLMSNAAGCPYLDLPGRRSITRLSEGRVWWDKET